VKTMAEVLAGHVILSGGGWFACSNTECGWQLRNTLSPREFHASAFPVGEFAAHQEAMLTAAGFGPVKAARAGAWDEGHEAGLEYAASTASIPDANPYRAASIEPTQ